MREHGHIGVGLPVSGDQETRRPGRPARRRPTGPRPVRPPVLQVSPRPDTVPAVRRPMGLGDPGVDPGSADSSGVDPGGVERGVRGFGVAAPVDARGAVGRGGVTGAADAVGGARGMGAPGGVRGASAFGGTGVAASGSQASGGARTQGAVGAGVAEAVGGSRAQGAVGAGGVVSGLDGAPVVGAGGRARSGGAVRARAAAGARVLVRGLQAPAPRRGDRVRRVMAGLALVLAAAAVVVGLGRVADLTAQARVQAAPAVSQAAEVIVTVAAPGTVWDVADGVVPGASGPQRAALVDRIVVANSLTSMRVRPGQVLRVPL